MSTIETRSSAELWRLRNRAENLTIRELLNVELMVRWKEATPPRFICKVWRNECLVFPLKFRELHFNPIPGQP